MEMTGNYNKVEDLISVLNSFLNDTIMNKGEVIDGKFICIWRDIALNDGHNDKIVHDFKLIFKTSSKEHLIYADSYEVHGEFNNYNLDSWIDNIYVNILRNIMFLLPNKRLDLNGFNTYDIPIYSLIKHGYEKSKEMIDERFK